MKPTLKAVLSFLLVFVLAAACLPAQKITPSDDALFDMVKRKLANDPDIKGGALDVKVANGVVTLAGSVDQNKHKQKAEKIVRKMRGVKQVVNNLTVRLAR
jgi:osmotically-inducible protein OsmY